MQRCLGCMQTFDNAFDICPHCGYVTGTKAASKMHLEPGTTLQNRYTLGRVLGQGGFGITYIAWDNRLQRAVAVKEYMPSAFASRLTGEKEISCYNEDARRQFRHGLEKTRSETQALAQFNDLESVVKVYDCIGENGTAYIIMELLRGKTVREILSQRGKLPFAETMRIMTPILQTLDAMHAIHLIHRDVAPDNIFVCENGMVKLLDFGAARVISGTDDKTISIMLKAGYAPIEQYSSKSRQGAFTDVYAASATMYKMLTDETPPDSLSREPDGSDLVSLAQTDTPPAVQNVILHGMALNPANRIQNAQELLRALETAASAKKAPKKEKTESAPRRTDRTRNRIKGIAACVLAAAAVVVGVIFLANRDKPTKADTSSLPSAQATVHETITFGTYEQDNNLYNGKEPIEWIVLQDKGDRKLLISKYALDCQPYHDGSVGMPWESSSLRKWLNAAFLKKAYFTASEQDRIMQTDAGDKVFLLSDEEALTYFASDTDRKCAPTAYAIGYGATLNKAVTTADGDSTTTWWLRSTKDDNSGVPVCASVIDTSGTVDNDLCRVQDYGAVRPVMWITEIAETTESTTQAKKAPQTAIPVQRVSCSSDQGKGKYGRSFGADMAVDGDYNTCWMVAGDVAGRGNWIQLDFGAPETVSGIRLLNGNGWDGYYNGEKVEDGLFDLNGRIQAFTLTFSDGTTQSFTASDVREQTFGVNVFYFDQPVTTQFVRLQIDSGYPGSKWTTVACLSELEAF